ncbi:MAG: SDR family NAD(P)-dependent oxidoreductase [bacterium]|nr:SDR family NAD(P)-dependent oxidoreductase [bacterium]
MTHTVLVIGATGGLGQAFTEALLKKGNTVLIAGRDRAKLEQIQATTGIAQFFVVDIQNPDSISQLVTTVLKEYPQLDVVVNVTGYDVRKPFADHTLDDVTRSLDINLKGAIWLSYTALAEMKHGVIIHIGGFADGYLALPFYSANVASRAGLRGFIDSMNRELRGGTVRLVYFCPSPADTEAERPFHALWKQLGSQVVSAEAVAQELLKVIESPKTVYVMGGWLTRFFTKLNGLFPKLANALLLNRYGQVMKQFFTKS